MIKIEYDAKDRRYKGYESGNGSERNNGKRRRGMIQN